MNTIINVESIQCEGCRKYLTTKDYPYLFRSIGKLCNKCKLIAYNIICENNEY